MKLTTERLLALLRAADPSGGEPQDGAPLDDAERHLLSRIMAEPTVVMAGQNALRRGAVVVVALLAGGGIGTGATSLALAGSGGKSAGGSPATPAELSRVSTKGSPIRLVHRGEGQLHLPTGNASLLAIRGDRAFIHLDSGTYKECYGESVPPPVGPNTYRLDLLECGEFPSVRTPVLDQSVFELSREGGFRVLSIQGFAADGVATVAATDEHGSLLAETAVNDNVYKLTAYSPASVAKLVARDPSGRVVYSQSFG